MAISEIETSRGLDTVYRNVVITFVTYYAGRDSCAGDSGSGLMTDVELATRPYDPRWIQVSPFILFGFGPFVQIVQFLVCQIYFVYLPKPQNRSVLVSKSDQSHKSKTIS
jgi:hypothetical protein